MFDQLSPSLRFFPSSFPFCLWLSFVLVQVCSLSCFLISWFNFPYSPSSMSSRGSSEAAFQRMEVVVNRVVRDAAVHYLTGLDHFGSVDSLLATSYSKLSTRHALVLLTFGKSRVLHAAAVRSVCHRLSDEAARMLDRVYHFQLPFFSEERTRLVLCIMAGFVGHFVDTEYFPYFGDYAGPINLQLSMSSHESHRQRGVLSLERVSLAPVSLLDVPSPFNGSGAPVFNFTRLALFREIESLSPGPATLVDLDSFWSPV